MTRAEKDEEREERIEMRIIVDTYSPEEQAWGWCEYLDDTMDFLFEARCVTEQEESPLEEGETVRVVGMSPTDPTLSQMFVTIEWMDRTLGVPLSNWSRSKPVVRRTKRSQTGSTGSIADNRNRNNRTTRIRRRTDVRLHGTRGTHILNPVRGLCTNIECKSNSTTGRSCSVMLLTMFPMGRGRPRRRAPNASISISSPARKAGKWTDGNEQATFQEASLHTRRHRAGLPRSAISRKALHIEPRDYQQAALDAWIDHDRRGSVVLPTGSGKTFLGLQAIADAGVSTLVVTPTIDLMNQWHATLTNAFGDQLHGTGRRPRRQQPRRHRDHRHHLRQRLPLRQRVRRSVRLARRRRGTPPASPDLPADPR